ncbi:MAG: rubrerythrin [Beijerinckiaceae bacterium]|nr:rubrerythrin [Beijerinckiaceae bacterium]
MLAFGKKPLSDLTEREVLALAIANEEEDSRIYQEFADVAAEGFPASAEMFRAMAEEEREHRARLFELFRSRFGENLPPIRREDVRGFMSRRPVWLTRNLSPEAMREEAALMEIQAANFYDKAASQALDTRVRELFLHLAEVERGHRKKADALEGEHLTPEHLADEAATRHRQFVLTYVQPGLAGLIDGSVSTLAPLFAAAFATQSNWETFLVGLAASVGAGISMGITEAMSDDGIISGRGSPVVRGIVCGLMTCLGGLGHTLPYLVPSSWPNGFWIATTLAGIIVAIELVAISWIRTKYMDTPFLRSVFQVVVGGVLVLLAGIVIGGS